MEDEIATKLQTSLFKRTDSSSGGCISSGFVYQTDQGKVFVKSNSKQGSDVMFHGEYESLVALREAGFPVPSPLCAGTNYLVTEYVNLRPLRKFMPALGTELGKLHTSPVNHEHRGLFGFHTTTCCGFLPLCNDWENDWVSFFTRHRLDACIRGLCDQKLTGKWSELQICIPKFFKMIQVKPSLLHGDLWSGNAGETENGPITYDPASFYGHSEFDLAIGKMFGGFNLSFLEEYHKIVPKELGFNDRQDLYLLFHHLNHWRHFGGSYRQSSLDLMSKLIEKALIL